MKKKYTLLCLLFWGAYLSVAQTPGFYYAFDEKIPLKPIPAKAVVKFSQPQTLAAAQSWAKQELISNGEATVKRVNEVIYTVEATKNLRPISAPLRNRPGIASCEYMLATDDGFELGLTNEILLAPKDPKNQQGLQALLDELGLALITRSPSYVSYRVPQGQNSLAVANRLQESGLVVYATPDFLAQVTPLRYIPNDPYFGSQFNLHNTGQGINDGHTGTADADVDAPEAWDISRGSSDIVVAVIDEGVTSDHADLPNTRQVRLNGSNFAAPYDGTNANDPSPVGNGNHGNACAGIIAATMDNNEGIAGIAPSCMIMPIRVPFGAAPVSVFANAIDFAWQNGADILSNSWSTASTNPNLIPSIVTAIQNAVTNGRGGLGAVVAFASGNNANHTASVNGYMGFPSNVTVPNVLTVGASDRYDLQANYSGTSNPVSLNNQLIDVVAPSHRAYCTQIPGEDLEIWSIDIPGNTGYNPQPAGSCAPASQLPNAGTNFLSYTARMGGTSAATPLVAGIAALVLSVSPNLTAAEVFNIITCSANEVGGYTYTNGFSNELGFGRVNAFDALMASCIPNYTIDWPILSGQNIAYQASDFIQAVSDIQPATTTQLKATNSVSLRPGFHASQGATVRVFVEACSSCVTNSANKMAPLAGQAAGEATPVVAGQQEGIVFSVSPNPFTHSTTFAYTVTEENSPVSLWVYNVTGGRVATLVQEAKVSPGRYTAVLSGEGLPDGVYLYRLEIGAAVRTGKILLVR